MLWRCPRAAAAPLPHPPAAGPGLRSQGPPGSALRSQGAGVSRFPRPSTPRPSAPAALRAACQPRLPAEGRSPSPAPAPGLGTGGRTTPRRWGNPPPRWALPPPPGPATAARPPRHRLLHALRPHRGWRQPPPGPLRPCSTSGVARRVAAAAASPFPPPAARPGAGCAWGTAARPLPGAVRRPPLLERGQLMF